MSAVSVLSMFCLEMTEDKNYKKRVICIFPLPSISVKISRLSDVTQ